MEEIEICAKCGKMVPMHEGEIANFTCPRCGNHATMNVPLKDYEKVVQRLQEGKPPFEEVKPKKKSGKSSKNKKKR